MAFLMAYKAAATAAIYLLTKVKKGEDTITNGGTIDSPASTQLMKWSLEPRSGEKICF